MDQWQKRSMLRNLYFIILKASIYKFEDTLMVAIKWYSYANLLI